MADTFKTLLGETLVGKDGTDIGIEAICGEGKTVGFYFSAHWCPPCRSFTPKLAEFYKKLHTEKNFEIVFVSSDKKEDEFKGYYEEMPWLALPFCDRDRKEKLSKKFKVSGIPTLVLLDGKDGKVITKDARSKLLDDPNGEDFPWHSKGIADLMKNIKLVNNKQEETPLEELKGKVIGFYFSAHWCPPCRGFTPNLIMTYKKIKDQGKPFEIIFVSSDRGEESFKEYFNDMPWLAVPFGHSMKSTLSKHFGVQGIPTLIIVDENCKIISSNGRGLVTNDPEGENFPWKPKPFSVLDEMTVPSVNDEACLIYFTDGEDSSLADAQQMIQPVAEHYFKMEEPPVLFFYTKGDDISDSLRDFVGLPDDDDDNQLAILDIPNQKYYTCDEKVLTRESVEKFVTDFANCKLEGNKVQTSK